MRKTSIPYEGYKNIKIKDTITNETFMNINENKYEKQILVTISQNNDRNEVLNTICYCIKDDYYTLLMSEHPNFAPNKPRNEYREDDIWYIIDLIRNESVT